MSIGTKLSAASAVVTSKAGRSLLKTQKHSPVILFSAGVIGFGATVFLASKATLELDAVLTANEKKQGEAHDLHELTRLGKAEYPKASYDKDMKVLKIRLVRDITKLYAPAALVGLASIGALTGSHVILTNRNTGLMAAYAAIDKSYSEYRKRVIEEFGPDKDRELSFGAQSAEFAIENPDGSVTVQNQTIYDGVSRYAKIWSKDTSTSWSNRSDYNMTTLQMRQSYMNDILRMKGHVLLNDVYDALGLDRTKEGCVVGWIKGGKGNNYIDFGIGDHPDRLADFITGREQAILLDFNVDGVIYDLI